MDENEAQDTTPLLADKGTNDSFSIPPPWVNHDYRPMFASEKPKGYPLTNHLALFMPKRPGAGLLHRDFYCSIMRQYRHPEDPLGESSSNDWYFSKKQINSKTLAERKEVKMALDAQLRILPLIAHWIDRLLHLINPEEYHKRHGNLPLPVEIMQQWDQDADRAIKTVIA
jgi:hypothetical protein